MFYAILLTRAPENKSCRVPAAVLSQSVESKHTSNRFTQISVYCITFALLKVLFCKTFKGLRSCCWIKYCQPRLFDIKYQKVWLKVSTCNLFSILSHKFLFSSSAPIPATAPYPAQEHPAPGIPQRFPSAPLRLSIQATSETSILTCKDHRTPAGHRSYPPPANLSTCHGEGRVDCDGGTHVCLNQQQGANPRSLSWPTKRSPRARRLV